MLAKIKGAVEKADHFEVDDGSGKPFRVAKAALSPHLVDRVRRLYCGGKVHRFDEGGTVPYPDSPLDPRRIVQAPLIDRGAPAPVSGATFSFGSSTSPAVFRTVSALPDEEMLRKKELEQTAEEIDRMFLQKQDAERRAREEAARPPPAPAGSAPGLGVVGMVSPLAAQEEAAARESAAETPPASEVAPARGLPSPVDVLSEARKAGTEAARRIAEAGEAAKRSLDERAAAEANARAAEYSAATALVSAQEEAARRAEQEQARLRDVYEKGENALRLQREKLASREKELVDPEAMRIETRRVFSRADPAALIVGAMMVGAAEAGLRKGSGTEAALKVIGDAIDRDILTQKTEKEALRSSRFRAYEAAVGDAANAAQLLKADQQLLVAAQARAEAQRTQSAQGRLMLSKLATDLSSQARKTAEEAVQLVTGQAIAAQKAGEAAQAGVLGLRQAEAELVQGQEAIEKSRRQEARADAELEIARAKLGLEARREEMAERVATGKAQRVDFDMLGRMGVALSPEQYAQIDDAKASASYISDLDDKGRTVYLRARNEKAAEKVADAQAAAELAKNQLDRIEKYIPGKGKSVTSRMFWGEDARKADAEVEAATEALTTQLKEIERLGALTGADLGLLKPRVPTAQAWFTSDEAEAQRAADLRDSIDEMLAAIKKASIARPYKPTAAQGAK